MIDIKPHSSGTYPTLSVRSSARSRRCWLLDCRNSPSAVICCHDRERSSRASHTFVRGSVQNAGFAVQDKGPARRSTVCCCYRRLHSGKCMYLSQSLCCPSFFPLAHALYPCLPATAADVSSQHLDPERGRKASWKRRICVLARQPRVPRWSITLMHYPLDGGTCNCQSESEEPQQNRAFPGHSELGRLAKDDVEGALLT